MRTYLGDSTGSEVTNKCKGLQYSMPVGYLRSSLDDSKTWEVKGFSYGLESLVSEACALATKRDPKAIFFFIVGRTITYIGPMAVDIEVIEKRISFFSITTFPTRLSKLTAKNSIWNSRGLPSSADLTASPCSAFPFHRM